MSREDMQRIWLRKQFSGRALPPQTVYSEEEILERVASVPGAIGYLAADKVTDRVRVLLVIP